MSAACNNAGGVGCRTGYCLGSWADMGAVKIHRKCHRLDAEASNVVSLESRKELKTCRTTKELIGGMAQTYSEVISP